jgi:hypothetical protein
VILLLLEVNLFLLFFPGAEARYRAEWLKEFARESKKKQNSE